MKIVYRTNFSGYLTVLRAIQLLIKNKTLNFSELGAYICLVTQADYDKRHKLYGVIIRDDNEIARELNCDPATIYRHRVGLIKKGLLIETKEGYTRIPNFFLFELSWVKQLAKMPVLYVQELFAKPQIDQESLQRLIANLQEDPPQKTFQSSNISSKRNLGSSQEEEVNIDDIPDDLGKKG